MEQPLSNDSYASLFKALADETRVGILRLLAEGERSVGELAEALGLSLPRISHHLAILRAEGLISDRRLGKQILCSLPSRGDLLASKRHSNEWMRSSFEILDILTGRGGEDYPDLSPRGAAEVIVFASSGLRDAFQEIAPLFEEQTGLQLRLHFDRSEALFLELEAGNHADVLASENAITLTQVSSRLPYAEAFAKFLRERGQAVLQKYGLSLD